MEDGSVTIDALISRMQLQLGSLNESGDARRFFHATYLRTTAAVRDALQTGRFADRHWVERWDIAFADLYLAALAAAQEGAAVPQPWSVAFRAAAGQAAMPPLRHVLLGMNAHINYDLPQALLAVISDEEFQDPAVVALRRADHERIDEVLAERVGAEDAELTAAGPRARLDSLLMPANQAASRRFLREARSKVWANAQVLSAARSRGPAEYAAALARLEALSGAKVAELVRPGQVLLRLAVRGFGVRLAPRPPGRGAAARRGAAGTPSRLRSFEPARVAGLECATWVAYYQRRWPRFLVAAVGMVRAGFGMSWSRTMAGAWYVLRANQLWAPLPGNDPDGARRCMRRFYGLVAATYGEPANAAELARLEVEWWRVHRDAGPADGAATGGEELVSALTRLYAAAYEAPDSEVRPAAVHRARAMALSDQWVAGGRSPDSPLIAQVRAALVRSHAALLAAVHR